MGEFDPEYGEEELQNDLNDQDNLVEEKQIPNEEPPSLEPGEGEFESDPPKNGTIGFASKKLIAKLLKKKVILISVIVAAFLFLIILFTSIGDSSGVNDFEYLENQCKTVTVNYNPYNEDEESTTKIMDIEEYVAGATYAYTKDLVVQDETTFHLYKALDIALRTEAVANNCVVTYRDKKIDAKPTTGVNMDILNQAIDNSIGVIITKKGAETPMNVKISDFCYQENNGNNYSIFQVPDFYIPTSWVNKNVTNEIYRDCPCNQPDDNLPQCWVIFGENNSERNWLHQGPKVGFNVYAACYLLEEKGFAYDTLIQYFLGDHDFKTINDPNAYEDESSTDTPGNSSVCEDFDLFSTSLSRSEFVSAVQAYKGADGNIQMQMFKDEAGHIYDIATENGINPEFIVIRAIKEGFSPSSTCGGPWKWNFWGVGCTNKGGCGVCVKYDSWDDALLKYSQYLKNTYKDMTDLKTRYAYLGDYWYNPGNSGDGGCYYAPYIYPDGLPEHVQRACATGAECEGSACVPTTEEDRKVYGDWQFRGMSDLRKKIFPNAGSACASGKCQIWAQCDPRWKGDQLINSSSNNMCGAGCAVTSVAMAMSCSGKVKDPANFSPKVLNNALKSVSSSGGAIEWGNKAISNLAPGFHNTVNTYVSGSALEKAKAIEAYKKPNTQVIFHIENSEHPKGHYIVFVSRNGENINVLDPAGGKEAVYYAGDADQVLVYEY